MCGVLSTRQTNAACKLLGVAPNLVNSVNSNGVTPLFFVAGMPTGGDSAKAEKLLVLAGLLLEFGADVRACCGGEGRGGEGKRELLFFFQTFF